jgi:hypothetical protein
MLCFHRVELEEGDGCKDKDGKPRPKLRYNYSE